MGSGSALTNRYLGSNGNAARAMNLLNPPARIVWLVPGPPGLAAPAPGGRPLSSLIPAPVYAVAIQLGVVVLLAALWRMRRLRPLIPQPPPTVVRACATVESHGRLYPSPRSR